METPFDSLAFYAHYRRGRIYGPGLFGGWWVGTCPQIPGEIHFDTTPSGALWGIKYAVSELYKEMELQ